MIIICNFETSLKLKENGYDLPCQYCYDTRIQDIVERMRPTHRFGEADHNSSDPYIVSAPLYMDAVSWIKDKFDIDIRVMKLNTFYVFKTNIASPNHTDGVVYSNDFACYNAAILYTLKKN